MLIFFLELSKMNKVEKIFFQESWLSNEEFKSWLVLTENKLQVRCKRCKKTFGLSNMGVQALNSHALGKKHKEVVAAVSVSFKKSTKSQSTHSESSQRNA